MSNPNRHWCQDVSRDEAVRAAEDAAAVPAIMHRDLPEQVALLWASLTDILGRVIRLEAEMDAGEDEAEEAAPAVCDPAFPGEGIRTERVTLEFRIKGSPPTQWPWSYILNRSDAFKMRPGESVRVVDDATIGSGDVFADVACGSTGDEVVRLTAERNAARAEAERRLTMCESLKRDRDSADFYVSCLRARVAELEAAPAAGAGGEAKQEPVAWGFATPDGKLMHTSVFEPAAVAPTTTVVPLYAAPVAESATTPPEPRGWLTAKERGALERAFDLLCDDDGDQPLAGTVQRLLARSSPPRVKVPMCGSDFHWIAAIREAGVEVEE